MKKKRHSIKDIARTLNVSATTVSFVLNGKGKEKKISDGMIKRVLAYTEEINYKPNRVAKSLRTGETKVLVFMVEDISNHFFAKIARIMEDIAYAKGYRMLFSSTENEDERTRDLINVFYERQVDGFIIIPSAGIERDIAELVATETPVVLFDRFFPGLDTHYVVIDNYTASYKAARHLIENDYRRIAFVTTDSDQVQMHHRQRGYEDALHESNLSPRVFKVPFQEADSDAGREILRELFTRHDELDAVYFSTNYLTRNGLEILKQVNGTIENIGIVTFDDNDLFRINTPSITAVAQPLEQMGEALMHTMLTLLKHKRKGGKVDSIQTTLQATLIPRGSSISLDARRRNT